MQMNARKRSVKNIEWLSISGEVPLSDDGSATLMFDENSRYRFAQIKANTHIFRHFANKQHDLSRLLEHMGKKGRVYVFVS